MKVMRVKQKPVVSEAIRVPEYTPDDLDSWASEICSVHRFVAAGMSFDSEKDLGSVVVVAGDGFSVAKPGDWIVRDIKGEFHAVPNELFHLSYEETDQPITRSSP